MTDTDHKSAEEINPNKAYEWLQKATLEELVNKVIWESAMEGTAHCGWTDRARDNLVKNIQDSVKWAITQKSPDAELKL
jgi:hypothetical protein